MAQENLYRELIFNNNGLKDPDEEVSNPINGNFADRSRQLNGEDGYVDNAFMMYEPEPVYVEPEPEPTPAPATQSAPPAEAVDTTTVTEPTTTQTETTGTGQAQPAPKPVEPPTFNVAEPTDSAFSRRVEANRADDETEFYNGSNSRYPWLRNLSDNASTETANGWQRLGNVIQGEVSDRNQMLSDIVDRGVDSVQSGISERNQLVSNIFQAGTDALAQGANSFVNGVSERNELIPQIASQVGQNIRGGIDRRNSILSNIFSNFSDDTGSSGFRERNELIPQVAGRVGDIVRDRVSSGWNNFTSGIEERNALVPQVAENIAGRVTEGVDTRNSILNNMFMNYIPNVLADSIIAGREAMTGNNTANTSTSQQEPVFADPASVGIAEYTNPEEANLSPAEIAWRNSNDNPFDDVDIQESAPAPQQTEYNAVSPEQIAWLESQEGQDALARSQDPAYQAYMQDLRDNAFQTIAQRDRTRGVSPEQLAWLESPEGQEALARSQTPAYQEQAEQIRNDILQTVSRQQGADTTEFADSVGIAEYHNPEEDNLSPAEIAWRNSNDNPFDDVTGLTDTSRPAVQDNPVFADPASVGIAEYHNPEEDNLSPAEVAWRNRNDNPYVDTTGTQTNPTATQAEEPEYVEPKYGAMTSDLWNSLYASLPDTMTTGEKADYVERMMNGDGWNYQDAMYGIMPDEWAVPWVDETDNTYSPALQHIIAEAESKDVITVMGDDGKPVTMERPKPQDPFHWLSLFIDPDAEEGGLAFRGLGNVPEECYELLASSARNGDSTSFMYSRNPEYFNGTDEEYNELAQKFISNMPALQVLVARNIISMDDVIRFFFKAPKSQKKGGNNYGGGGGYRSYGGGGGGYIGGSYKPSVNLPTPTTAKQQQNRIYNIMKNWSF